MESVCCLSTLNLLCEDEWFRGDIAYVLRGGYMIGSQLGGILGSIVETNQGIFARDASDNAISKPLIESCGCGRTEHGLAAKFVDTRNHALIMGALGKR